MQLKIQNNQDMSSPTNLKQALFSMNMKEEKGGFGWEIVRVVRYWPDLCRNPEWSDVLECVIHD